MDVRVPIYLHQQFYARYHCQWSKIQWVCSQQKNPEHNKEFIWHQWNLWECLINNCTCLDKLCGLCSGMIPRFPKSLRISFVFLSFQCNNATFLLFCLLFAWSGNPKNLTPKRFPNLYVQFIVEELDGMSSLI